MVWCRKIWRDIAAFRCESCPEAVEVNRTLLCGRLPGTPPDPDAMAEADNWGQVTVKPKGERSNRRNGRTKKPSRLNVTMRDKGDAAQSEEGANAVAPAAPAEGSRNRRVRRAPKRAAEAPAPDVLEAASDEVSEGEAPALRGGPTERKKSGRRRGGRNRRRGRGGSRRKPDSGTTP